MPSSAISCAAWLLGSGSTALESRALPEVDADVDVFAGLRIVGCGVEGMLALALSVGRVGEEAVLRSGVGAGTVSMTTSVPVAQTAVALREHDEDRQRILEAYLGQAGGGGLDQLQVAGRQRALESAVG